MTTAPVLYTARTIHTLSEGAGDGESPTGILVSNGRIVAVGDAETLRRDAPEGTREHAFGDATITPGLIDGHSHPLLGLEWTSGEDLSACTSIAEVRDALAAARERIAPGEWLRGWGLNPIVFGDDAPNHAALGEVFAGVPAYLLIYDGHSAVVSETALALAGVTGTRPFVSDARIAVDDSGVPTGHIIELEATELFTSIMPVPPRAGELRELLGDMARTGLTGAHVMDLEVGALDVLEEAERLGELPMRLDLNPWIVPSRVEDLDDILGLHGRSGRRWRVEGVKFFLDGTVDGGTAWLEEADCCGEGRGTPWGDAEAFSAVFTRAYLAGVNTATHAIGDRAVRVICELVARLEREHGPRGAHRVEHIETASDAIVELFAERRIAASMQPLHATRFARADRTDTWSQRLGDERARNGFRCRDLRDAGAVLALGSDWPISAYDPRTIMADAVLRRPFDDATIEPVEPRQALTPLQALEGYTTHAALASGEAAVRGSLGVGMLADLTVWEEDPLGVDAERLGTLGVVATVVGGELVGGEAAGNSAQIR